MSSPATSSMGARSSGGLRKVNVMPWFDDRNAAFPVIVKSVTTFGSACEHLVDAVLERVHLLRRRALAAR